MTSLSRKIFTSSAADEDLKRLLSLRVLSVAGQLLAILVAVYYLDISLPLAPLFYILAALLLWSLFSWLFLKNKYKDTANGFFLQLLVDVASLSAVLYFTGGATNPFAWFLLLPHSVASTLLSRNYVWLMALITSVSYSLLVFYYQPLLHLDHHLEMGAGEHFKDHVIGMWLGFVSATILLAHFVAGMAESLRKRNELLLGMKERIFRDERIVALGTLATGAAHELGTPLGTMDIVAHELALEVQQSGDEAMYNKLTIIQGQIKRCKQVLLSITESATADKYETGQVVAVDEYIKAVVAQWRISHLGVGLQERVLGCGPKPTILSDVALTRALINILDNAAQASPEYVMIRLNWSDNDMLLEVVDRGAGMDPAQLAKLGSDLIGSTEKGLGIGVYLSKASIERIGGEVQWNNGERSGVRVTIKVPLTI